MAWWRLTCTGALALMLLPAACGDDEGGGAESESESESEGEFAPDQVCPGDPDCPDEGDGVLHAGAGLRDVTPRPVGFGGDPSVPTFELWEDVDGNGEFEGDVGDDESCPQAFVLNCEPVPDCDRDCRDEPGDVCPETGPPPTADCFYDDDGDGCFDAIWLTTGGHPDYKAAAGIRDPIWARCVVLSYNATRVALCAVDTIGYFLDPDVLAVREMLDPAWDIDLLLVSATHDHSAPTLIGLGGPANNMTGQRRDYARWVREQITLAVGDAVGALAPANVTYGQIDTLDGDGLAYHYVGDSREPIVFSPELHALQFTDAGGGDTIATLVNWAAHPEYTGLDNITISSDYPNWLRQRVEAALGGTVVYVSGPLGGQVGPGRVCALDPDDLCPELHDADGFVCEKSDCKGQLVGEQAADFALQALSDGAVTEDTGALSFRRKQTYAQIQNTFYHAAGLLGVFDRGMYNYDCTEGIDFNVFGTPLGEVAEGNLPDILTEVLSLRIGRAHIITIPGELHPELYLGCYATDADGYGECSYDWPVLTPKKFKDDPDYVPPDLSTAPPPPYLIDLLTDDPDEADVEYRMVFGLTPDMLGYILPLWNFALGTTPYIEEAPGDHYEETNSIGPTAETQVIATLRRLLCWRPDGTMSDECNTLAGWGFTPPVGD